MRGCLLVSQPSLSTQPTQEPVSVSYAELLLGNAEEFGVWPWTGSLCANHHSEFLRLPGAVHSSIKTLRPSHFQNNTGTHIMHLNTETKRKKQQQNTHQPKKKTNNGKIAFFGQGQPVHFDYLFSLVPHYFFFFPHTLALFFTRWLLDFWRIPSRFPILKAHTALSTHSSSLFRSYCLNTFYYDYAKLTAKSSISNSTSAAPSRSRTLIYFIARRRHRLFYVHGGGGANTDQQPLCTAEMVSVYNMDVRGVL